MGNVWGIYGDAGSGKTTLCAKIISDITRDLPNCLVYSRLKFNIKNWRLLTTTNIIELEKSEVEIMVVWDEAYEDMDKREFMTLKARINSYIIFQRRKRNLNFIGIAPIYMLDVRWRKVEKLAWFAKDRPLTDKNGEPNKDDFVYWVTDWKHPFKKMVFPYKKACKYFPLFDTMQMLQPHDMEDIKIELIMQDPKALNAMIDKYTDILLENGKIPTELKHITHDAIKNEMLSLGLNLRLASYVYIRLRYRMQEKGAQK